MRKKDTWHDPDDAPELDDAFFERADRFDGPRLMRRGRPPAEVRKVSLTVRYDPDIIEAFRTTGLGWQTRMNDALREWLRQHAKA
ncbi:BrnA antitoxin family protein [Caldichromatium japonicum]|uniref:BrnA antitoxin family protein n=1 Tax=Caldichromatium japonicum TaxID=2699430 RepID=A0A6G7VE78_9GAMM|nr:BrnA antitoxin family protein [Caldichromatium japonicum]QIK38097.1 BrnA antitoxin family protein [Caldichromatium japonicum]